MKSPNCNGKDDVVKNDLKNTQKVQYNYIIANISYDTPHHYNHKNTYKEES